MHTLIRHPTQYLRTGLLTAMAMVAFAANSLLCRMALGQDLIDAASFTSLRIVAGAVALGLIVGVRRPRQRLRPNWSGVIALFAYMAFFSFAYVSLNAGTGALILFGSVQLTMFGWALHRGERYSVPAWIGLAAAFGGLVYLIAPGVTAPDAVSAVLMSLAGLSWGAYSLFGRNAAIPLHATAAKFVYSVPLAVGLSAMFIHSADVSLPGALLAIASGAVASGLGYALWYAVLPQLSTGGAATVQLSVPVIAAIGGLLLLSEPVTARLVVASTLTIGGIWVVLRHDRRKG